MLMLCLDLMTDLDYSASFRFQRINFCDPEPVQSRQEWFKCRWAFYGALNDTFTYRHLTDLLDKAPRRFYFVHKYTRTNGHSGPNRHHNLGRVSQCDERRAWIVLCIQ